MNSQMVAPGTSGLGGRRWERVRGVTVHDGEGRRVGRLLRAIEVKLSAVQLELTLLTTLLCDVQIQLSNDTMYKLRFIIICYDETAEENAVLIS